MATDHETQIETLAGETLTHIDVDEKENVILLTTESGRQVRIEHDQDCCESVYIEDTEGDWRELIGKPIIAATEEIIPGGDPPPQYPDSWTRTNLTFKVDGATVINRWIGESNGYYSETVDIKEIGNPASMS